MAWTGEKCPACNGHGEVQDGRYPCPACGGTGDDWNDDVTNHAPECNCGRAVVGHGPHAEWCNTQHQS